MLCDVSMERNTLCRSGLNSEIKPPLFQLLATCKVEFHCYSAHKKRHSESRTKPHRDLSRACVKHSINTHLKAGLKGPAEHQHLPSEKHRVPEPKECFLKLKYCDSEQYSSSEYSLRTVARMPFAVIFV